MGDLQIQKESMLIPHKQKQSIIIPTSSMLDLHHHTHNNSIKRRSPPSSSSDQPSSKKHSFDQIDLTRNGFSAITLPFSLRGNVLRGCVSDPCTSQEQSTPARGLTGLPPLAPIARCISEVIDPSDVKEAVARCLKSAEETNTKSDSMRLKRMKDRLKEMKKWWDEVMEENEKEQEQDHSPVAEDEKDEKEEEKDHSLVAEDEKVEHSPVAEDEKVLYSQDGLAEDYEEAISVEWIDKCLSLTFKCPCGKGYEVLISENNCYYRLV